MRDDCRIAAMLRAQKKHVSFHTPGHKRAGADITELSYSDDLSSPRGAIAEAERDLAAILGAAASFLLTDGSTCGVHAMLYALRAAGAKRIAAPVFSHPSVSRGCEILGLKLCPIPQKTVRGIPAQPQKEEIAAALEEADALLLTSPDYYGFFAPLEEAAALCRGAGKPLAVDGAHGSHLHFTAAHAGKFADLWVDGAHKSLPALTQGALVSAKEKKWAEKLREGALCFRTTSPSYPIMASVEYAFKYPRNEKIERAAEAFKCAHGCVKNDDWSKILVPFGERSHEAARYLEAHGVYPEFDDGNYLMFYLSPCTKERELKKLSRLLKAFGGGRVEENAPAGAIPMYSERP